MQRRQAARGRPRSEVARRAILEAAKDLIAESGYENLTIHAIAARSKTGRQTIYRWWTSKALIVADVVVEDDIVLPSQPVADTGSLRADLALWPDGTTATMIKPGSAAITRALITAASDDEDDARRLCAMTTGPFHATLVQRLVRGKADGQLRSDVDERAIADALNRTLLFRTLTQGADLAPSSAVVDAVIAAP